MRATDRAAPSAIRALDRWQRGNRPVGFVIAVGRQYVDDGGSRLAALIAYYAFVSLFPLLGVFTAVLGFVLEGHPDWQSQILDTTLGRFPVIGDELQRNLGTLPTSGTALVAGLLFSLWVGLAAMRAARVAFDTVWDGTSAGRVGGWRALVRSLAVFGVLGGGLIVATALTSVLTTVAGPGPLARLGLALVSLAWNIGLFLLVFRLLTSSRPAWSQLWAGAVVAGVGALVLQSVGALYLTRVVVRSSELAGTFGVVLGLIAWIYLQAQMVLLAMEVNVVRARRSWPRALVGDGT